MSEAKSDTPRMSPMKWGLIGFVIGALAVGLWTLQEMIPTLESAGSKETKEETAGNALLSVSNQMAGKQVIVHSVAVPPPGVWVAVHEIKDGKWAGVLGAAHVRFQSTNVAVDLLRETVPASDYVAVLYRDDGDDVFSLEKDSVYIDFDSGERIEAPFKTEP